MSISNRVNALTKGLYAEWVTTAHAKHLISAFVCPIDSWEPIHIWLTISEIEQELVELDDIFSASRIPIAVDLGGNYCVLTENGEIMYFDYTNFYSENTESANVYLIAPSFEQFIEELREEVSLREGTRAAYLRFADSQRSGGTQRDEIWHFAGKSLQCVERKMFTRFVDSEYRRQVHN